MDTSDYASIGATVVIGLLALLYTARAANAAREQTRLQRQIRQDSAQPYVWVDIRPDDQGGGLLVLYVGNSGPTVATNVRVRFDPPLDMTDHAGKASEASAALTQGINSLTPGRRLQWNLGVTFRQVPASSPVGYRVTIESDSLFGPMPPLSYVINLQDIRFNLATPPGTLNGVSQSVDGLTKAVNKVRAELETQRPASGGEGEET